MSRTILYGNFVLLKLVKALEGAHSFATDQSLAKLRQAGLRFGKFVNETEKEGKREEKTHSLSPAKYTHCIKRNPFSHSHPHDVWHCYSRQQVHMLTHSCPLERNGKA
jgi:hypothetical protein